MSIQRHNPRECWCGINHGFSEDPTQRVEAMTTPEGAKGWESVQARHNDTAGGHGLDVAPDASPEGVRAEARRLEDGAGGEPSNAPVAGPIAGCEQPLDDRVAASGCESLFPSHRRRRR